MPTAAIIWGVVFGGGYFLAMWWIHVRRLRRQRQFTRSLYAVSESVVEAGTAEEIASILSARLPALLDVSGVALYWAQRPARLLTEVGTGTTFSIDSPPPGVANAAAVCARNRTPLAVPDTRNNPLVAPAAEPLPRALLLIPLVAHEELLGVLEIHRSERAGAFAAEVQAAAQHLGNLVSAALKMQQQRALQQQLQQGEALAATGQILTGIARELKAPLAGILHATAEASRILKRRDDLPAVEAQLAAAAAEAARTQELVSRMLAFSGGGPGTPGAVSLAALLERIRASRASLWQEQGIEVQVQITAAPAQVMGVEAALEQLILGCMLEAETGAARQPARSLKVNLSEVQNRARIEVSFPIPPGADAGELEANSPSAVLCGIAHSHGGECRQYRRAGVFGYEISLPCVTAQPAEVPATTRSQLRPLTVMLVDPELATSRPLVKLLAARGHRVVPVASEEAAEVAPRLRFDAVFWAARAGRGSWGEALETVRSSIRSFVVVADGYSHELAASLEKNGAYLLARPVEEASLDRILAAIGDARP
jgi:signal transduction histidine kinase